VDTGGEDGVTHNAYAWLRSLRRVGLSSRVMLLKGGSHQDERPMFKGAAKLNNGKAMKDMPVWILNTNYFKDLVAASLRRKTPGPGYFHVPRWLPDNYFDELRAEVRDTNGKWRKIKPRNEALDLWVYSLAILESLGYGPKGRLSWTDPPAWAAPLLMGNSELITAEERKAEHEAFTNVVKRTQSAAPAKAASLRGVLRTKGFAKTLAVRWGVFCSASGVRCSQLAIGHRPADLLRWATGARVALLPPPPRSGQNAQRATEALQFAVRLAPDRRAKKSHTD
jgi:phage terminase large subunit GpA-like protein